MHFTRRRKKLFGVLLFALVFLFAGILNLQASRGPFAFHAGSPLRDDGTYIYGLTDESHMSDLQDNLIDDTGLSVKMADGSPASETDFISTGCTVTKDGNARILIVKGDINGDGSIMSSDYMIIKSSMARTYELSDIQRLAADTNGDGEITSADYLRIRYHFAQFLNLYDQTVPTESQVADDFTVSKVFDSNMVIQRDEIIRIWGWAPESQNGKYVKAEFQGLSGYGLIEEGAWEVTLNGILPADASSGNDLVVSGGEKQITFRNVLVGDVYFVMGQSNAQWPYYAVYADLPADSPAKDITVSASDPIRLYRTTVDDTAGYPAWGTTTLMEDVGHDRGWQLPSKTNVDPFSALGYYFAKQLSNETPGVPVGVIEIAAGGMALNAFFPNELADEMKIDTLTNGIYTAPSAAGNVATRFVYNQYMYPFQRFSTAGIIWYQGESDLQDFNASEYAERFTALMEEYRARFDLLYHPDIPVYVVELPSIYREPADYSSAAQPWQFMDFGAVRAEMGVIPSMLSDVYFVSSSDIWKDKTYWNNLHPYCKWEQAERLVDLVLAVQGEQESLETVCGPVYDSHFVGADGKSVTITFEYAGSGLKSASGALRGFYVKNGTSWVEPDSAEITSDNQVTVTSSGTISGVRYDMKAEDSFPETINLCNSTGMPAVAFSIQFEELNSDEREQLTPVAAALTLYDSAATEYGVTWHSKIAGQPIIQYMKAEGQTKDTADFTKAGVVTAQVLYDGEDYKNYGRLYDLEFDTEYLYRVGDARGVYSETFSFTTRQRDVESFTFIHTSDSQDDVNFGSLWRAVLDDAFDRYEDAKFVVNTGDIVQNGGSASEWEKMLGYVSPYVAERPLVPVAGNHDYWSDYLYGKKGVAYSHFYMDLPEQDTTYGMYYSFDYGNAHFVVLNTGDSEVTPGGLTDTQLNWLKEDLENSKQTWKIIAMHNPLYSPGKYGSAEGRNTEALLLQGQLNGLFAESDVDLVLTGHDHLYSRTYPVSATGDPITDTETATADFNGTQIEYLVDPQGPIHLASGCSGNQGRWGLELEEKYARMFQDKKDLDGDLISYSAIDIDGNRLTVNFYMMRISTGRCELVSSWGIQK